MAQSKAEKVACLVRRAGVFRPRELDRVGIPREYLRQAKDRGLVRQVGRGLYVAEGSRVTEHHTLVEATKRVPHGVVCLLSALRFHGLTTQSPREVWMAIAHGHHHPTRATASNTPIGAAKKFNARCSGSKALSTSPREAASDAIR